VVSSGWGIWAVVRVNMLCATAHLQRQPIPSLGYIYTRYIYIYIYIYAQPILPAKDTIRRIQICCRLELGPSRFILIPKKRL
jgi:hypothetical protein